MISRSFRIRVLKESDRAEIPAIVNLHKQAFPSFFLTQLGTLFLKALYTGYLEHMESGIIIAEDAGKLVGFIAFSYDYSSFYKELIKKSLLTFAFCSFWASIRNPSFIKRLLGAFRKSSSVVKDERYVELASIGVDPTINGSGIGSALIDYLKGIVDYHVYSYINLETDADSNEGVNRFYQKNGFKLARQFTTPEGRSMNEYRYAQGDER